MNIDNKHRLNINDLEKDKKGAPVWALNSTADHERSRIIIVCAKLQGNGYDSVMVHNTFIPINLTEQVNRQQLLQSSDFRKSVSRGYVTLVTDEYAKKILNTEAGKVEAKRLQRELTMSMRERMDGGLNEAAERLSQEATERFGNPQTEVSKAPLSEADVKPAVMQIMVEAQGKREIEVYNSLKNVGGLTSNDWEYVLNQARAGKMKKLAAKAAAKIEDSEDDDE